MCTFQVYHFTLVQVMVQSQLHRADQRELSIGSLVKFQKGKSCLRAVHIAGILAITSEETRRQ